MTCTIAQHNTTITKNITKRYQRCKDKLKHKHKTQNTRAIKYGNQEPNLAIYFGFMQMRNANR